jgi:hypothetical protein
MDSEEKRRLLEKHGLAGFLRRHKYDKPPVSLTQLERGCREFEAAEPRDSMYRVSRFLLQQWWGDSKKLVDALSVLLLTWNSAFYRYGAFDESLVEAWLNENSSAIVAFGKREIDSFGEADYSKVERLFLTFQRALGHADAKGESPVGTAKALHLLAPSFFPIWDGYIAEAYNCPFTNEFPQVAYFVFCGRMREIAIGLQKELAETDFTMRAWLLQKPLLKRIDEYSYVTFTLPELRRQREKRQKKGGGCESSEAVI